MCMCVFTVTKKVTSAVLRPGSDVYLALGRLGGKWAYGRRREAGAVDVDVLKCKKGECSL